MNRTQHHERAEQLLLDARTEQDSIRRLILAEAQVHATLALSAPPGASPPGRGQPETRYAMPGWGHDQGSSESSASFEPRPDAPGGERTTGRRYPPGQDPLLRPRAGETRVSGPTAAPPVPGSPSGPEPSPPIPVHPLPPRRPGEQPQEQEPGPEGQSPVASDPAEQDPAGPAPF